MEVEKRRPFYSDPKLIGWIFSLLMHVLIIVFIILSPHFVKEKPEDAYEGILVSFGLPVESLASSEASNSNQDLVQEDLPEMEDNKLPEEDKELESTLVEEEAPSLVRSTDEAKPAPKKASRNTPPEPVEEENSLEKAKESFSQLFNKSSNKGQSAQQSGDPLGEPDASILEGISRGKGRVGGGLDERGVLYEPQIVEQSQKSGKVVVKVCVDNQGNVKSARFTQKGSTTTDRELVEIAEISARKYRFTPSDFEEQCGTISINFIVQ